MYLQRVLVAVSFSCIAAAVFAQPSSRTKESDKETNGPTTYQERPAAKPASGPQSPCAPSAADYPPNLVQIEATGTTKIRFSVGPAGNVYQMAITRSSGHPQLDELSLISVMKCTWPTKKNASGQLVGATLEVEYVWKLD
jgi:TonB family protein